MLLLLLCFFAPTRPAELKKRLRRTANEAAGRLRETLTFNKNKSATVPQPTTPLDTQLNAQTTAKNPPTEKGSSKFGGALRVMTGNNGASTRIQEAADSIAKGTEGLAEEVVPNMASATKRADNILKRVDNIMEAVESCVLQPTTQPASHATSPEFPLTLEEEKPGGELEELERLDSEGANAPSPSLGPTIPERIGCVVSGITQQAVNSGKRTIIEAAEDPRTLDALGKLTTTVMQAVGNQATASFNAMSQAAASPEAQEQMQALGTNIAAGGKTLIHKTAEHLKNPETQKKLEEIADQANAETARLANTVITAVTPELNKSIKKGITEAAAKLEESTTANLLNTLLRCSIGVSIFVMAFIGMKTYGEWLKLPSRASET